MSLVMYIIVRRDLLEVLKWPLGALMAQSAHASMALLHTYKDDSNVQAYLTDLDRMHKVVLQVDTETDLKQIAESLRSHNLDFKLWTEQPENIPTCIAVKPYLKADVHKHLKHLKLFS